MIVIAICDDELYCIEQLAMQLERYAKENSKEIKIIKFTKALQLLNQIKDTYDLIFLDIKMPFVDGIEVAEEIRKRDEKVSIIFLTSYMQRAVDGYEVSAEAFIQKPIAYQRLEKEMNKWFLKHIHQDEPYIIFQNNDGKYKVPIKSLKYIETSGRSVLLHTGQKNIKISKSMKEMQKEIGVFGFCKCHNSFLVNLHFVDYVNATEVGLITGEILPVSKSKRKNFIDSVAMFWEKDL